MWLINLVFSFASAPRACPLVFVSWNGALSNATCIPVSLFAPAPLRILVSRRPSDSFSWDQQKCGYHGRLGEIFGLASITLRILPCLDVLCPYRTPISPFLWCPTHSILSITAVCLRWLVELLHGYLVKPDLDGLDAVRQRIFIGWSESRERIFKTNWRYVTDGLRKSIINGALNAQGDEDRKIFTSLFNQLVLGDESKLRTRGQYTKRQILDPLSPIESGNFVLRELLRILPQSYVAGPHVAGPEGEVRKRSVWVRLDVIHYIAKCPCVPDLDYVRENFANIGLMRAL